VHIGDNVVIGPGAIIEEDVADGEVVTAARRNAPLEPQPSRKRSLFGVLAGTTNQ
jgi:serine acetyltransferase